MIRVSNVRVRLGFKTGIEMLSCRGRLSCPLEQRVRGVHVSTLHNACGGTLCCTRWSCGVRTPIVATRGPGHHYGSWCRTRVPPKLPARGPPHATEALYRVHSALFANIIVLGCSGLETSDDGRTHFMHGEPATKTLRRTQVC